MIKSVDLADRAIETHMKIFPIRDPENERKHRPKIALSLGPYGSTLEVAAEFTGIYPPPYGPGPSSLTEPATAPLLLAEELSYIDALATFHFSRLLVYARNPAIWNKIDILAFETVPLLTEAKAIRIAVARLIDWFTETMPQQDGTNFSGKMKPWYISFVFVGSEGEFPQHRLLGSGASKLSPYTPYEIASSVFTTSEDINVTRMAPPDGIGINCTSVRSIGGIVQGIAKAITDLQADIPYLTLPWLVLCPNGGGEYDTVNKVWMHGEESKDDRKDWADTLTTVVQDIYESPFEGFLLGGCCNTTPHEIQVLRDALGIQ
jgi:homocysteine S-methyltransferase